MEFYYNDYLPDNCVNVISFFFKDNKLEVKIRFFRHHEYIGMSGMSFKIEKGKIIWDSPFWISEKFMNYCERVIALKAFG